MAVLAVANAALILHTVRRLLGVARERQDTLPHWPESLDLSIPGLPAPATDRAARWPADVRIAS
jgi:hypothetical protein